MGKKIISKQLAWFYSIYGSYTIRQTKCQKKHLTILRFENLNLKKYLQNGDLELHNRLVDAWGGHTDPGRFRTSGMPMCVAVRDVM